MQTTVGLSAGSEVICCVLLTSAPDGSERFDYRVVTADNSHSDVGDLVSSALDLATTTSTHDSVGQVAVTYRTEEQAQSIRTSSRHHEITLVPETPAALTYLRHTGEVARYEDIVIVDLGASGTTVTVVDQVDGTVHESQRTAVVSGRAFDDAMLALVTARVGDPGGDPALVGARLRTAKEHLSSADSVVVEHVAAEPFTVTRAEFDTAIAATLAALGTFVRSVVDASARRPHAVAVIGGGSLVPAVISRVEDTLELPVVRTAEPDVALAKGAALLVRSSPTGQFPIHVPTGISRGVSLTRTLGVLAAAAAAIAVILAYGLQALGPASSQSDVTQAATASKQAPAATPEPPAIRTPEIRYTTSPYDAPSLSLPSMTYPRTYNYSVPATTTPSVTPTPSLRPAPGLPTIALPELPPWLTEIPGVVLPSPDRNSEATPPPAQSTTTPPTTTTPAPTTTTEPPVTSPTPVETSTPASGEPLSETASEVLPSLAVPAPLPVG